MSTENMTPEQVFRDYGSFLAQDICSKGGLEVAESLAEGCIPKQAAEEAFKMLGFINRPEVIDAFKRNDALSLVTMMKGQVAALDKARTGAKAETQKAWDRLAKD